MKLDYQKITQIVGLYTDAQKSKLYFELMFSAILIASVLHFGVCRLTILAAVAILRKVWKILLDLPFFQEHQLLFNVAFGLYTIDVVYLFYTCFRVVSIYSRILICYQLVTNILLTNLQQENSFVVDYYLKVVSLRVLDQVYIFALVYIEIESNYQTIMLSVCFTIQILMIQLSRLLNDKGELLKQHAKSLSVWIQLQDKPAEWIPWNETQDKYPPQTNVLYNNHYYNLQNLYNTSPPEDIKTIAIQFMFFNLPRTKRLIGILGISATILLSLITIDAWIYNLLVAVVIILELKK